MANDAEETDRVKAELHWAIQVALEKPEERDDAIGAAIELLRELALRDAEALMMAELRLCGVSRK